MGSWDGKMTNALCTCMKISKNNDFKSLLKHLGKETYPWLSHGARLLSTKAAGMLHLGESC